MQPTAKNQSPRHISRTLVVQVMYELDINDIFDKTNQDEKEAMLTRNRDEFAPELLDLAFAKSILNETIGRRITIDEILQKAAPEWPIEKISIVDRNILRVGLCELLFGDRGNVPPKVAIDEAIEIAKEFGGDTSGKFVNGVLGAIYKELGEPDKNQIAKKENLIQKLVGSIVYAENGGERYIALVHDVFNHWTLSKGQLKDGENENEGAIRVTKEEVGIEVKPQKKVGENEYIAHNPEKGKVKKHVIYILCQAEFSELKLGEDKTGLTDVKWFNINELSKLNMYEDLRPIVMGAVNNI